MAKSACSSAPAACPATATIEDLGAAFASFSGGFEIYQRAAGGQVDVVAHSMGGLVLRCYLSGKQNASGVFQPPAATHVRKAVFLATPNFGHRSRPCWESLPRLTRWPAAAAFLFGLDTWNEGTDDLRGVDAVAAAGNAGSGGMGNPVGFDDGVVPLTSASLRFYLPGRTRVFPIATSMAAESSRLSTCVRGTRKGIANIDSATARFGADHLVVLKWNERLAERRHGGRERSVSLGGWRIDCRGTRRRRFQPEYRFGYRG